MPKLNWTWTFLITGTAAIAWLSCSKIESPVVFWDAVVKLFIYSVLIWIGCSVLNKIYCAFAKQSTHLSTPEVPEERKQRFEDQRKRNRQCIQNKTNEKVESYKERILIPREEARRQKQDEELNLIMGHTFRGSGQQLGEDDEIPDRNSRRENINEDARERRRLPPDVVLHRPKPESEPEKKRRVIELPGEPDEEDGECITVTLHTPLDQRKSRRFLSSSPLQAIIDYMTTLGFNEAYYTLTSAYPRKPLTDCSQKTLKQLKFEKRTLLYVEEN
ncbi:UBX domain-containing protein 8-like [Mercenaria mercenaria]|uniref:UBX domain-containing protein 8-like n=1 Tax=Mercenaria mercenaria TaxID=6596 RepID=UPI00234F307D|nr:UBX domain-containing protein 8-like [Mercenaria mercenaria]